MTEPMTLEQVRDALRGSLSPDYDQMFAWANAIEAHLDEFAPYLKKGETPVERIKREIRDCNSALEMLRRERVKNEELTAHLAQPAQAVDVGNGSAHRDEDPVKLARAVCEAVIKHQFQDKNRHGRLTLDVQTFLRELNAARDSGMTRDLSGEKAGPVVDGLVFAHPAAVKGAAEFLLERFDKRPCDSRWVSCCIRCAAVALSRWALAALAASTAPDKEG